MASKLFVKKVCAVRFRSRSAAVNGRAADGRAAVFFTVRAILRKYISGALACYAGFTKIAVRATMSFAYDDP